VYYRVIAGENSARTVGDDRGRKGISYLGVLLYLSSIYVGHRSGAASNSERVHGLFARFAYENQLATATVKLFKRFAFGSRA